MTQNQARREATVFSRLDALYPEIEALYTDLHQHPELSMQEVQTALKVATRLKAAGYNVTTGVGGTGVVGLLRNGTGPTVMLRGDMDALPIEEKTNLPYASKVTMKNRDGELVPVAHACGHDIHTSCLVGTGMLLAQAQQLWRGTVMIIAQPGEETMEGAAAMLKDGLFTRFPKPDAVVGQHTAVLPVGMLGYHSGYTMSAVDNLHIRLFGKGAHGAMPQEGIDPVIMAAALVMRLQTIPSREVTPGDVAIVTVGAIQAGTRYNIIPDEAVLELTVRTFKDEVREQVLAAIRRIAKAEALASNAPHEPDITVVESSPSLYNDPELTERIVTALTHQFGSTNVVEIPPLNASEDFSLYGHTTEGAGIPCVYYYLGVINPKEFQHGGQRARIPGPHSPFYAPEREASLKMGMQALTVAALTLLGPPPTA